jgi:hypothetical protein
MQVQFALTTLRDEIKQILETRPPGRPKKHLSLWQDALDTAREMMKEQGIDTPPVFKAVAIRLGAKNYKEEKRMGARLREEGHPWSEIKKKLVNSLRIIGEKKS